MTSPELAGTTPGNAVQPPTDVHRLTLANDRIAVSLLTLGAGIDDLLLDGASVVLGLDTLAARDDPTRNPYLGVTVGRFANRLGGARFAIDGLEHRLDPNEGDNQLHGGPVGFSHVVWDHGAAADRVRFHRTSPAGEMGYPGTLAVEVTYHLDDTTLRIEHTATTDAPTVVSLTNHAYWNLGGPAEPDVLDHQVTVDASQVVPVDEQLLPSGPPTPVADGPFDLRRPTRLGDRIGPGSALPDGYDHCFMIDGRSDGGSLRRHARISHRGRGRSLEVWSDQPAAQLYTGGGLAGGTGLHGRRHDRFAALCVEPQHVPDAPNLDWAPTSVLRPGERYRHRLELRFEF